MTIQVLVCRVGQRPNVESIDPTLEIMQALVGGLIQVVPLTPTIRLVCNEEGELRGLPLNCLVPARGVDLYQLMQALDVDPNRVFVMGAPGENLCLHGEMGHHEVLGDFFLCREVYPDENESDDEEYEEDSGLRGLSDEDIEKWAPVLNACRVHYP